MTQDQKHTQSNQQASEIEKLNQKILDIKNKIDTEYPELSEFLSEMPVSSTNVDPLNISVKDLKEYLRSLEAMVEKYQSENPSK